jgi:hypothetical protein
VLGLDRPRCGDDTLDDNLELADVAVAQLPRGRVQRLAVSRRFIARALQHLRELLQLGLQLRAHVVDGRSQVRAEETHVQIAHVNGVEVPVLHRGVQRVD